MPSLKILGGRVDSVSLGEIPSLLEEKISAGQFFHIITANSLMLLETDNDAELRDAFNSAELVIPDSVGITLVSFLRGFKIKERIPGIDLMVFLCGKAEEKGWPVYLVGSKPGVAEQAKFNLLKKFPGMKFAGTSHGYFNHDEEQELLRDIREKKSKIVFVGLDTPFQEKWISGYAGSFGGMCVMGVGGSLDVLSGHLRRAPLWAQKCGMEWFYRFIQEPWRWKRIIRIPIFLFKALFV